MEIIVTLFNLYGLVVIGVLLIIVLLIWITSHFLSNPGGKVFVLYGLVSYDRKIKSTYRQVSKYQDLSSVVVKQHEDISGTPTLFVRIDDELLIDTETQRAGSSLTVFNNGVQLNQLAIVLFTMELKGSIEIVNINLSIKRKRPGNIITGLPRVLGQVSYQNVVRVTPLGMEVSLQKMKSEEKFRLQLLTDGIRASDFYVVLEPNENLIKLKTEKSEDWLP